jgi:hypothetical protein
VPGKLNGFDVRHNVLRSFDPSVAELIRKKAGIARTPFATPFTPSEKIFKPVSFIPADALYLRLADPQRLFLKRFQN